MAVKPVPMSASAKQPKSSSFRRRPLIGLMVLGTLASFAFGGHLRRYSAIPQLPKAIIAAAADEGLLGLPSQVRWIDSPGSGRLGPTESCRFVALLHRSGEAADVWLGRAKLSREGRLVAVTSLHNLSDTSAVGEQDLTVAGHRAAWVVADEGLTLSLHVADLDGVGPAKLAEFSPSERLKVRLTFLQDTGQTEGVRERVYRLTPPRRHLTLEWLHGQLSLSDPPDSAHIDASGRALGSLGLDLQADEIGRPGDWVTWAVDRVRAIPWFGADRMQWLKAVAFQVLDYGAKVKSTLTDADGSSELRALLGDSIAVDSPPVPDPITGWPPAPIAPLLLPALPGEGVFTALDRDAFAVPPEGGSSPFAFTFLRADPTRPQSQVFIVAWDPKRLELHVMTGTREPKTATGETGPGQVPRTKEVMGRLAAAFNGGFQATHGEFGMMASGIVYLPPKPYAATIAEFRDGSAGFGTWPNDETIAPDYVGFRQNLTPLTADGTVNPYRRTWWGGVPAGWEDATRTVRTGLCLTGTSHIAYFYGSSIDSDHLAATMSAAGCTYGLHLDMNPGHTGLEFYRVAPAGALPDLKRKLDTQWEARGPVSGMPGWEFLGRRMIRSMHLMNFPRYARTDSRDFLYLTHRQILTKERLADPARTPQPKGIEWQNPVAGFPPALAYGKFAPQTGRDEVSIAVAILDGKWLTPRRGFAAPADIVVSSKAPAPNGELCAIHRDRRFAIEPCSHVAAAQPSPAGQGPAVLVATGKSRATSASSRAALGTTDGQWLFYVEVTAGADPAHDARLLDDTLRELGCESRLLLERPLGLATGSGAGTTNLSEKVAWVRNPDPLAVRILKGTPVVPFAEWSSLQAKRVRYHRQRKSPSTADAPAGPSAVPSADQPDISADGRARGQTSEAPEPPPE